MVPGLTAWLVISLGMEFFFPSLNWAAPTRQAPQKITWAILRCQNPENPKLFFEKPSQVIWAAALPGPERYTRSVAGDSVYGDRD